MGILIKLYLNDSKEHLNLSVQDYDKETEKCKKTILDIMLPLMVQSKNVSDIDDFTDDDLLNNSKINSTNNNLEKVLSEELGIEINNVIGNACSFKITPSKNKSESPLAAVVSMTENCSLSDKNEEKKLNTDNDEAGDGKNVTKPEDTNLENEKSVNMTTEMDEDVIFNGTENCENNNIEAQNNPVIVESHSVNVHESIFASTTKPCRKDSQGNLKSQIVLENEKSKSPTVLEKERSNSPAKNQEDKQSGDCEFIIEEVMDLDCLEEDDRWSINDVSEENDDERVVDLTTADLENVNLRTTHSIISSDEENCFEEDPIVTVNDFSDDEDDVRSQYSSARQRSPRRAESDNAQFGDQFVPLRRALSNPPENSVQMTHDNYETRSDAGSHIPHVVDLTSEKDVECVDLTNDKKSETSSVLAAQPIIIERSVREVMDDIRNFYKSNKDIIDEKKKALVHFGEKYNNKRRGGIEAPPKLSNGLSRLGKRCGGVCYDDSENKSSKVGHWSSIRERKSEVKREVSSCPQGKSLNKFPIPTCGPPGFHINDDLHPQIETTVDEDITSDASDIGPIHTVLNFHGNRNVMRGGNGHRFNARTRRNPTWRRFNQRYQHHNSPLRRQNFNRNPTKKRGEWIE